MKEEFKSEGATILVVKNIECKIYQSEENTNVEKYSLGTIIKEHNLECQVKLDDGRDVIIDKKYLVINLCDVMQKDVIYSITNSDKSIYTIHGIEIKEVTGKKLYPNMIVHNKLFVPLMYKTSEKLFEAEKEFLKNNLTIKIYDTYRPYEITKYLYKILLELTDKYFDYLNGEVNGHKYDQTDFLAAKTSTHNYGIALDMTLVNLKTNEELEMQTKMHDLSIYSVTDYNNENANMFAKVMSNHGFYPLESEWWHFQDNDSKVDYMNYYIDPVNEIKKYD